MRDDRTCKDEDSDGCENNIIRSVLEMTDVDKDALNSYLKANSEGYIASSQVTNPSRLTSY
jgi:hypothetical protein